MSELVIDSGVYRFAYMERRTMPAEKKKMECCVSECPKAGDVYVCSDCKMTVTVTKDCTCPDANCVCLACCGHEMTKVN